MFRFIGAQCVLLIVLSTGQGFATEYSELRHSDLIDQCLDAIERDDRVAVETMAEELLGRSGFNLGPESQDRGSSCLQSAYGLDFEFGGRRFYSQELLGAQAHMAERAASVLENQQEEFAKAIVEACFLELEIDRFRALTTPACAEVFKTLGLPGSQ
ncbi:hypothetical protein [Ruegeria arenilitoris]|uniref:hypothetical protein n=1 Tax=Ruegeria arenilitoris TaxID=1173585 RepID=UPI00147CBCC3|nr:hypothetical protein [Ruegeria arenilitoris]